MAAGALRGSDRALLDLVQLPHATWLDLAASILSIAGQAEVTSIVALGVAVAWWRAKRPRWWLPLLLVAVVGVEIVAKVVIPQAPPPGELSRGVALLPFLQSPTAYSFPSGHVARVAFLTGALGWRRAPIFGAVALMSLAVVYLAEHWPSDVIGGWLLGYFVLALVRRP